MRLLTRAQYLNTVRDLFGDVDGLPAALGATARGFGVRPHAARLTQVELEGFQNAAELIALQVTADPARLRALAPCANGADAARVRARVHRPSFGARAYRAPLTDSADVDRHLALYDAGAETSYAHGIELLLRGMLQAPRFLYRVEIGTGEMRSDRAVALSGYEIAARLSYLVLGHLPDTALIAAADEGRCRRPKASPMQLARSCRSERGAGLVRRLPRPACSTSTDVQRASRTKRSTPSGPTTRCATRCAIRRGASSTTCSTTKGARSRRSSRRAPCSSTRALGLLRRAGRRRLQRARARRRTRVRHPDLARAARACWPSPTRARRSTAASSCARRCSASSCPRRPPTSPSRPRSSPGVSTRERLRQHEVDPACSGCHQLIDPIGFGFEHFDAIGRYRDDDGGKAVDARGELVDSERQSTASSTAWPSSARSWRRAPRSRSAWRASGSASRSAASSRTLDACSMQQPARPRSAPRART